MKTDITNYDYESVLSYLGYEYRLSSGNRGLQINVKTCPNCHSNDYKVYFNAESFLGNCFRCDEKWNLFKFLNKSIGGPSSNVFRFLENNESIFTYKPKKLHHVSIKANKDWKLPLNLKIENDDDLPGYLVDRGIDAKIAKRFDLRNCQAGFYRYEDYQGNRRMVDFSNRIIIPIYDVDGKPATFQGRDITGTSPKKYLFPNMLPGTARYIYNAHYVIKNRIKRVILNEGVFDVFATTKALESEVGYKDWAACGTFGKHFSIQKDVYTAEDQLADLAAMKAAGVEEFVIMWDGEPKARTAAIKAALKLRAYGFPVTVALDLPDGCDPAETTPQMVLKALNQRRVPTNMMLVRSRLSSERIRTGSNPKEDC
jgi:DNA primase